MTFKEILQEAHRKASFRGPCSTQVLIASYQSNGGNIMKSVQSAINCFGGKHAPIEEIYEFFILFLNTPNKRKFIIEWLPRIIPGLGSAFVKGSHDPILDNCFEYLYQNNIEMFKALTSLEKIVFNETRKALHCNIGIMTAAYCYINKTPIKFSEVELFNFRLPAWIEILKKQQ